MWKTILTAIAVVCPACAATVKIHGYVTSLESSKKFQIDEYKVTLADTSAFELDKGVYADAVFRPEELRIGSELEVQGDFNDSTHELQATSVRVFISDNERVKRSAVVEHTTQLERSGNVFNGVIHADGQLIKVDAQTRVSLKEGQTNLLSPGLAIIYEGVRNLDGSISATRLEVAQAGTARAERNLLRLSASKVSSEGEISIHGTKYKLVPDAEAQSYVQRVGGKLVPTYFRTDLSNGAARNLPFQFYLVSNDSFNAHAFPTGTVIINSGVFRVLTSEAQLAAVLGHEIAHATQEHAYREMQYLKKNGNAQIAENGYAGSAKGDPLTAAYNHMLENQADRVGLEYMVAAGYDPREAPEVWKQVSRSMDESLMRRSYLLAQLKTSYTDTDFTGATRDREEFDRLAERFGNKAIAQRLQTVAVDDSATRRPGFVPSPAIQKEEKRYGPNSVNIISDPPGANVVVGGRVLGKTPLIIPTGSVGMPFIVSIQLAGYRIWTGQMVSVPGRTNLRVELFSAR